MKCAYGHRCCTGPFDKYHDHDLDRLDCPSCALPPQEPEGQLTSVRVSLLHERPYLWKREEHTVGFCSDRNQHRDDSYSLQVPLADWEALGSPWHLSITIERADARQQGNQVAGP